MYNRYIPQPDGSYRRRSIPEQKAAPGHTQSQWSPIPPPCPPEPEPEPCPPPKKKPCGHYPRRPQHYSQSRPHSEHRPENGSNVPDFFRNLLPKDFDTGDLLIILLLLLMAGDCQEDQNTALLTLALYLFL